MKYMAALLLVACSTKDNPSAPVEDPQIPISRCQEDFNKYCKLHHGENFSVNYEGLCSYGGTCK